MGRFVTVILFALLSSLVMAQETAASKAEIFGGYSYLRNNSNGFNGFTGQGTVNLSRYFGVTAQVDGNYRSAANLSSFSILGISPAANQHLYDFLAGPTATARFGKNSVFAHALFGVAHSSLNAGVGLPIIGGISTGLTSASGFAMAFGGGVDLGLTRRIALRVAQIDYLRTQFNATDALLTGLSTTGARQNSWRYSAGIVFRF
jgi:hypothetical protein